MNLNIAKSLDSYTYSNKVYIYIDVGVDYDNICVILRGYIIIYKKSKEYNNFNPLIDTIYSNTI